MTINQTQYGQYEHGQPFHQGGGTWRRSDKWTSNGGVVDFDLLFVVDKDDDSPLHDKSNGGYSADCSCCWLNFAHSHLLHEQRTNRGEKT